MKRRGSAFVLLTMCIAVLLLARTEISSPIAYQLQYPEIEKGYTSASSLEQFVSNDVSDVDGIGDLGSHSNFANQQLGPDAVYDTLTEENTEAITTNVEDDYDSYLSDVDSSPDVGVETNTTNAQGTALDSQFMTIQETDAGDPFQSAWLDTNAFDGTYNTLTMVGTTPYLDSQDEPANYVYTKAPGSEGGWWDFPDTTLSGDITVNVSIYCWNLDGAADDGFDIYYDTSGGAGTLLGRVAQHTTRQYDNLTIVGILTQQQVNALRIRLVFYKTGGADNAYADHLRIGISTPKIVSNDADFEYSWNAADNDESHEEVCINIGSIIGNEALNVSYWDGIAWTILGQVTSTGWTNLTAIGMSTTVYVIQLRGANAANDPEQSSWTIDLITLHTWTDQTFNYELDLEVQWTAASFDNNNEFLCIYAGDTDAEDITIDVWDGLTWVSLLTDLQANSWSNISVETWLTSSTFTIRFKGGQEVGDLALSQWSIDATLLHTWNYIPSNDQQPAVGNIDDGSYLYAKAREYLIAANISDQDGYGTDLATTTLASDGSCDTLDSESTTSDDCEDSNALEFPGQSWWPDHDMDGYATGQIQYEQCMRPFESYASGELTATSGDCDDSDSNIYPGGPPLRIYGTANYYSTRQAAYDAASNGDIIECQEFEFTDDLNANLNKSVTFDGGYDCGFIPTTNKSTISANTTISDGVLTLGNIIHN